MKLLDSIMLLILPRFSVFFFAYVNLVSFLPHIKDFADGTEFNYGVENGYIQNKILKSKSKKIRTIQAF